MSGRDDRGSGHEDERAGAPNDVSEEYAEVYRRAFALAYERGTGQRPEPDPSEPDPSGAGSETGEDAEFAEDAEIDEGAGDDSTTGGAARTRSGGGRLLLFVVAALVLVVGAYGLGRVVAPDDAADSSARGTPAGDASGADSAGNGSPGTASGRRVYSGPVTPITPSGASSSCQADPSRDASGHAVTYEPTNAVDGDPTTAWRCAGSGRGQSLTLSLPAETEIGEVGLVPGYAKTDKTSGADRYAQNNRVTRVRWSFSSGDSYVTRFSGAPDRRRMQRRRIPVTTADSVTVHVLDSVQGPRNMLAVSEVLVAGADR